MTETREHQVSATVTLGRSGLKVDDAIVEPLVGDRTYRCGQRLHAGWPPRES